MMNPGMTPQIDMETEIRTTSPEGCVTVTKYLSIRRASPVDLREGAVLDDGMRQFSHCFADLLHSREEDEAWAWLNQE